MKRSRTEHKLLREIMAYLISVPELWFYHVMDSVTSGLPDILGVYHGRIFVVEVKDEEGKLSLMQKLTLGYIREAGGKILIAKELKQVKKFIKEFDEKNLGR